MKLISECLGDDFVRAECLVAYFCQCWPFREIDFSKKYYTNYEIISQLAVPLIQKPKIPPMLKQEQKPMERTD